MIRAFGKEKEFCDEFRQIQEQAITIKRIQSALNHYKQSRDFQYSTIVKATTVGCCMAQRGLVDTVTLMLLINQVQGFESKIEFISRFRSDFETKLEKVQKIINFENLVQEVDEQTEEVPRDWPTRGRVAFNLASLRYRP